MNDTSKILKEVLREKVKVCSNESITCTLCIDLEYLSEVILMETQDEIRKGMEK